MGFQGITITVTGNKVVLDAPYHPGLSGLAHRLHGKFDGTAKTWSFDARDEARVRNLAREIWGHDGSTILPTVTVRWTLDWSDRSERSLWLAGREIAFRPDRDARVRLGDDVIIVAGNFDSSGGSVKNPRLAAREGTVLEIRNVVACHPDIAPDEDNNGRIEVLNDNAAVPVDPAALRAERTLLAARIAEIDALLAAASDKNAAGTEPQS